MLITNVCNDGDDFDDNDGSPLQNIRRGNFYFFILLKYNV